MAIKKPNRRKGKAVFFRVDDPSHARLIVVAKKEHRRSVADLMYAKALELAEGAEARS